MGRRIGGMFTLVAMLFTFLGVTQALFTWPPTRLLIATLGCIVFGAVTAFAIGFGLFMLFTRGEG